MNPQYTESYLNEFYSTYQELDGLNIRYGDKIRPRELIHGYNLEQIEKYSKREKFLSVGCGNGLDIKVAKERGWIAEGYEVDENHARELSDRLETQIHSGDFSKMNGNEEYSCIYMNHVLEHPKRPGEYLSTVRRLLKPDGIMYIACPNIDSVSNRIKNMLEGLGLRKEIGKHYDTWHHLFYYSPTKLKKLLEKHYGFEVLYYGNDKKGTRDTTEVIHSFLDDWPYKSSFRLIARKIKKAI